MPSCPHRLVVVIRVQQTATAWACCSIFCSFWREIPRIVQIVQQSVQLVNVLLQTRSRPVVLLHRLLLTSDPLPGPAVLVALHLVHLVVLLLLHILTVTCLLLGLLLLHTAASLLTLLHRLGDHVLHLLLKIEAPATFPVRILDVPCALLKPILQVPQCPLSQVSTTWPPGQGKVTLLTSLLLVLLEVLLLLLMPLLVVSSLSVLLVLLVLMLALVMLSCLCG